jgi:hypothetical protein
MRFAFGVRCLLLVIAFCGASAGAAAQDVPAVFMMRGRLVDATGAPRPGTFTATIALYINANDPIPAWTETQSVTVDASGSYEIWVGAGTIDGVPRRLFTQDAARWAGLTLAGEAEMPRTVLTSVPYAADAAVAGDAQKFAGRPVTDFVLEANLKERILAALNEATASAGTSSTAVNAPMVTSNALVKYVDAAGTLGESLVYESAGRLGVGTAGPQYQFDVVSTNRGMVDLMRLRRANAVDNLTDSMFTLEHSGSGDPALKFMLTGGEKFILGIDNSDGDKFKIGRAHNLGVNDLFTLDTSGQLGLGTAAPMVKLHVSQEGGTPSAALVPGGIGVLVSGNRNSGYIEGLSASSERAHQPGLYLRSIRSRGTLQSPTAVRGGDLLTLWESEGFNGAARVPVANIGMFAESVSGPAVSGYINFLTMPIDVVGGPVERMRIDSQGNVGIASTDIRARLQVNKWSVTAPPVAGIVPPNQAVVVTSNSHSANYVGVGATNIAAETGLYLRSVRARGTVDAPLAVQPGDRLSIWATDAWDGDSRVGDMASIDMVAEGTIGDGRVPARITFSTSTDASPSILVERVRINSAGNVGIGTPAPTERLHVSGNARIAGNVIVDGTLSAKYQDVAEWVNASEHLPPGTVVSADVAHVNRVRASRKAYDTAVLGVVSAQPGLLLGEADAQKVPVAQSGRVKVKVDARFGAIRPGDLLVTSPTAGYAMRSKPLRNGMHRPGTLVGKALEGLATGQGEILVLVTLQ